MSQGTVLVLSSGGIDSTACIDFYLSSGFTVESLFIRYGQLAFEREMVAVQAITRFYHVPLSIVNASGFKTWSSGYVPGRNAFLLFCALMNLAEQQGLIGLGIHGGTPYVDCSAGFVLEMQRSFNLYTNGSVQLDAPFVTWGKRDIWNYCLSRNVPLDLTYSCEIGKQQPCGNCASCKDLEVLYAG